jgi:TolB-like protein
MKNVYLLIISCLISIGALAQSKAVAKPDVVYKINGDQMNGRVTKITDTDVTFIYSGETLEYTIKKTDIQKIVHSSGRVELIGQSSSASQDRQKDEVTMQASPVDHHNKIAILPFTYLLDNQPGGDQIGYKAQEDTYAYLSQHSAGYNILDPRTTNALLIKNGVTKDKMTGFTMKEICDILGVEYVIDGTVMQNKGFQTSSSSGSSNTSVKRNGDKDVKGVSTYGSNYSNSAQRYEVAVSLHIYMDTNASIYNQSHKAFWTNTDGAYSSPLEYLLKRCPLYRK